MLFDLSRLHWHGNMYVKWQLKRRHRFEEKKQWEGALGEWGDKKDGENDVMLFSSH